jgi:transposase
MIALGGGTRVFLACGPTDLRKSFDGLFGLVASKLEEDPVSGHLFVFCNRARTRLKVLFFDGSGLWVCGKRLEKGCFHWPKEDGKARVSASEWAMLVGGLDLARSRSRRWWRAPAN